MRKLVIGVCLILTALFWLQWTRKDVPVGGPSESSLRIVSMAPHLTGILFDIGAGEMVVGDTFYCDYPAEARSVSKIGDFLNPNLERIIRLGPNLILAEEWTSSKTVERLKALDFRIAEFPSPTSIEGVFDLTQEIGGLVGRPEAANDLVLMMRERTLAVSAKGKQFPFAPKIYLEIDIPNWTVGRASFTSEALEICGGRNIYEDLDRPAARVTDESLFDRDPDLIVSLVATAAEISDRPGWKNLRSVREGRIIDGFDPALLSRANLQLVAGMESLQTRIAEVMGFDQ